MKNNKGQALLIIIMLLATVVTIVMAVVYKSTTNTQLTKLEEESNKALVAAEAGLEASMRKNSATYTFTSLGLTGYPGIDLDNSNVNVAVDTASTTFVSPLILTDDQYTFYMVDFDTESQTFGANYYNGDLTVYFASETTDAASDCVSRNLPALEVVNIKSDNSMEKKLIEPCSNGINYLTGTNIILTVVNSPKTISGTNFSYQANLGSVSDTKLIIVRVLFAGTKIGIESSTPSLKPQGRTLTAQAKAISGVVKKVQLFQSYPQIPADFFVTSF